MAVNPLTPGVYIDEISVFPPSVAPVATAIPAFIGYTEKAPSPNVPTRITSMLDYEQIFGVAFPEQFDVALSGALVNSTIGVTVTLSEYTMHYNLRMYFANGGGPCYIRSVGLYGSSISHTDLITGINDVEKADEVTLLVAPEIVASTINSAQRAAVNDTMLGQCNKMKDRFVIMDVKQTGGTIVADAAAFRNSEVGSNNLKYGASYYPVLNTLLTRFYKDNQVDITDTRSGTPFQGKKLSDILSGVSATGTIVITGGLGGLAVGDEIQIGPITIPAFNAVAGPTTATPEEFVIVIPASNPDAGLTAVNLAAAINNHPDAKLIVTASVVSGGTPATATVLITAKVSGLSGNTIVLDDTNGGGNLTASATTLLGGVDADKTLYNSITEKLATYTLNLYPAPTMAGIYAGVDRDRGVWKAPANVSIAGVIAPSINITAADQEILNIDAGSGKSINAIRTFTGKGILVWGARTLAGNDNEWRYVSVRRLFIFAEESIQKASEFVVFEPNDRNTWSRVRSLISNFLTNLWRDGALAGATPDDAFFVNVGLGETMTAQDILEGKLIIQVGLAAVRPAEFIILQFSHKLQES